MNRKPKTLTDAANLLRLSKLLASSVQTVVEEWALETQDQAGSGGFTAFPDIPSRKLHDAQRTILSITGSLTELIAEPELRIMEVGCQYWESRALFIAAERRIPDMLAEAGAKGMTAAEIAAKTGHEPFKLSRILRCLCTSHIFSEPRLDVFTNNSVSEALVKNEPLRAYIMNFNLDLYATSEHMPQALLDPALGPSYQVDETAFQVALNTPKTRWEWLEEEIPAELGPGGAGYPSLPQNLAKIPKPISNGFHKEPTNETTVNGHTEPPAAGVSVPKVAKRPEHAIFNLAMLGGGRVHGAAHPYGKLALYIHYPWDALGEATVVDVGGGVGGFDIQLSRLYPKLNFVVQDRAPALQQAEQVVWPRENPEALSLGRVKFQPHDFFNPNPVPDAEVYWLRSILHDWSDSYCIQILSGLRAAMTPGGRSRILICDQLMNPTCGTPEVESAPAPLPANYGYAVRFSHQRDLCMMGLINGIERTPAELRNIVEKSGLKIEKVWDCRSQVPIVELRAY